MSSERTVRVYRLDYYDADSGWRERYAPTKAAASTLRASVRRDGHSAEADPVGVEVPVRRAELAAWINNLLEQQN